MNETLQLSDWRREWIHDPGAPMGRMSFPPVPLGPSGSHRGTASGGPDAELHGGAVVADLEAHAHDPCPVAKVGEQVLGEGVPP